MDDTELTAHFDRLALSSNKLGVRLDTLTEHVKLIAEGHGVLTDHIVEMKSGIERLETGQAELLVRVSAVESRVGGVESRVGGVESRVGGIESRVGGIESRMGGVESRVGGIESRMGGVESRVGGIEQIQRVVLTEVRGLAARHPG